MPPPQVGKIRAISKSDEDCSTTAQEIAPFNRFPDDKF